ncbi:putative 1-phosphatidylinositol-3-phosphate 5-kinase FAB1C [Typha angustifolia]|uniref:putative 1-phosphatidylinositol-3-phosphate 5-kinase FAB1C n=1 Tax=Typha angustifolia TaxID=59011 RepID=UPI003C2D5BD7
MGVADFAIPEVVQKVRSWINELSDTLSESLMSTAVERLVCYECQESLRAAAFVHRCRSCGRVFCRKCMENGGSPSKIDQEGPPRFCNFCFRAINGSGAAVEEHGCGKGSPLVVPHRMPELSLSRSGIKNVNLARQQTSFSSPRVLRCSTARGIEDEEDDEYGKQFFTPTSEFFQDSSDTESISVGTGNETHSFMSMTSSPFESPGRAVEQRDITPTSRRRGSFDQDSPGYLRKSVVESNDLEHTSYCTDDDLPVYQQENDKAQQLLDFESNADIWCPPQPQDKEDDVETGFFEYDDEDDEIGDSGELFVHSSFSDYALGIKEKPNEAHKDLLMSHVYGHFRALVPQLLIGEGLSLGNENGGKGWLELVSSLAWQAANFVKPDTSKGGSMDPGDYVKVKCIASGSPSDSTFVKGVVCSKNIKHKRMVSQHKNPRLFLLGGALEYQKASNKLASIDTVLKQEKDHLKMVIGKIEARRPNVLLVEKSVSSYAQELLAKEISLVLNVKRSLLDRISRCTGAQIASSIDNVALTTLGHCEMFRTEKVMEYSSAKNPNKSIKTLMFFEGCPRRLGCTVLLRGTCREELKKVKKAVQFASFAAYHLLLETSFFADAGATIPKVPSRFPVAVRQKQDNEDIFISRASNLTYLNTHQTVGDKHLTDGSCKLSKGLDPSSNSFSLNENLLGTNTEHKECNSLINHMNSGNLIPLPSVYPHYNGNGSCPDFSISDSSSLIKRSGEAYDSPHFETDDGIHQYEVLERSIIEENHSENQWHYRSDDERKREDLEDQNDFSCEYFSTADNQQSILVSVSSTSVIKGTVCEHSQLFRIKFYGSFDKPLGRFLRDDLFDQSSCCRSCKEPAEAHVRCYTHQQGSLTIRVRRLSSVKLPGERDGRIWMWHRCLKCKLENGVPPTTQRVIMSDAAWGLSFGKFLELSFSNHATANRIASCGHSLQRDCLRFYGYGSMVAFFYYSPVDILSVNLPPSVLDFSFQIPPDWVRREADVISSGVERLHAEVSNVLHEFEKNMTSGDEPLKTGIHRHLIELQDLHKMEQNEYNVLLQPVRTETMQPSQATIDILELNRLRRCLLIDSYMWHRRLYFVDSLSKTKCYTSKADPQPQEILSDANLKEWKSELFHKDDLPTNSAETTIIKSSLIGSSQKSLFSKKQEEISSQVLECNTNSIVDMDLSIESVEGYLGQAGLNLVSGQFGGGDGPLVVKPIFDTSLEKLPSSASSLSDRIDVAWTGSDQLVLDPPRTGPEAESIESLGFRDKSFHKKVISPVRVYSFDSALRSRHRERAGLSPTLHLSPVKSADSFGDFASVAKDPISNMRRAYSQRTPRAVERLNTLLTYPSVYISSVSHMISDGARLLLPQIGFDDAVIAIYDDEPTSIISYSLTSREYASFISPSVNWHDGLNVKDKISGIGNQMANSTIRMSFTDQSSIFPIESDGTETRCYGPDEPHPLQENLSDPKEAHFKISFDDEASFPADKAKFSVTCYFAKQFDALRRKCCPNVVDYIRSLSRCKRWSAQGGKSNVYFAKTLDERFIIKQVTKTELDSFEDFAPQYFKYLTESLISGSPTCLAKIVGLYQVVGKNLRGGRELKMDLMVMENLFFRRKISRVYDLKGSLRSRYNPDTSGNNKVLLDLNLLETLHTKPIFLGSKAKRILERAVWNDTSFLASVDVMDYSLLVGIDEERKELVIGIIDYMRQYTWDKQLETWVKASGILGGPKNTSPTVISPTQYKKRFRKAMSKYFLTVPDQWSS